MGIPLIKISIDGCPLDTIAVDPDGIRDCGETPLLNRHLLTFQQNYEPSDRPPLADWVDELEEIMSTPMIKREKLKKLLEQMEEFASREVDTIEITIEWDEIT